MDSRDDSGWCVAIIATERSRDHLLHVVLNAVLCKGIKESTRNNLYIILPCEN